jgi:AraC family transcriptional regulator
MDTPVSPLVRRELPDTIREQIGSFVGQIVLNSSEPPIHLHTSAPAKWRGAALTHNRVNRGVCFEGAWSSLLISHKVSPLGRLFMAQDERHVPPASANLQVLVPGASYRGTCAAAATEAANLYIDPALIERTLQAPYSEPLIADVAHRLYRDCVIEHLMRALLSDVMAGSPGGPLLGETIIAAIIHRLHTVEDAPSTARGAHLSPRERRLLRDHVAANLSEPLHLEDLADLLRVSVRHLCRAFRNTLGVSPHQYVLRCRVEHAQDLLRHSHLSLDAVAELSGFAHRTHMATAFRKVLDRMPAEIRDAWLEFARRGETESGF